MLALALDGVRAPALVEGIVRWLARTNFLLAAFNLVPAAPLDGGRVLQAVLWRRSGDRPSASATAAQAGRAFGLLLVGIGLLDVFAGVGVGGLWFVFLGWFLLVAARTEHASTVLAEAVADGARARTRVLATQLEDASLDPRRHLVGQLCGLELRSARPAIPWLA